MTLMYGVKPWEWDGGPDSKLHYGITLQFCAAIDRQRAEQKKAAK